MIVPLMTIDEMRKEFMHDYKIIQTIEKRDYSKMLFEMHKRKQTHAIETRMWKSPGHNRWMILYYLDGNNTTASPVCLTLDRSNFLRTLHLMEIGKSNEEYIAEHNMHFFKRYNERLRLGFTKTEQIVKHFYKYNPIDSATQFSPLENEHQLNFFLPVKDGVMLGIRHEDIHILEVKTFVSTEMLGQSQLDDIEFLSTYKESDYPDVA